MVRLQNIGKTYSGHTANHDISYAFQPGCITGLLGPNGAGKTTLIRIMMQIIYPDKGRLFFNEEKLSKKHLYQMGYLPEERGLYRKMGVLEHMVYIGRLRGLTAHQAKERSKQWLARLQLGDWAKKEVQSLSKGMQQKVQFASSVMHKPSFVVLDEPFSGLDPVNAQQLIEEVQALQADGITVVLSTHRMDQAQELCNNIALIHEGKLALEGTVSELRNRFAKNTYKVVLPTAVETESWPYPIEEGNEENTYFVNLADNQTSADLFSYLGSKGLAANEVSLRLPTLKEIFIQHVKEPAE